MHSAIITSTLSSGFNAINNISPSEAQFETNVVGKYILYSVLVGCCSLASYQVKKPSDLTGSSSLSDKYKNWAENLLLFGPNILFNGAVPLISC